jgi:signal transduction histidine kinase
MTQAWLGSFRARFLLIVLVLAVVPLGLLGVWLTQSAARSGEELLRGRLEEAVAETEVEVGTRWVRRRSDLLDLAQAPAVQTILSESGSGSAVAALNGDLARRLQGLTSVSITDIDGRDRGTYQFGENAEDALSVSLPIHETVSGRLLGFLNADIPMADLLERSVNVPGAAGIVLAAFDAGTGISLLPLPFDPLLLETDSFTWGGESWQAVRSVLAEPSVLLVAAAPLAPFTAPFRDAARRGTWLLLLVAGVGLLLTFLATGRVTRSLTRLATAADAVASGNLEQKVEGTGSGEIGRVAQAFNTMTESLRRTLRELADREAEAAAGKFAASLAHEVRNPLTAIRIDLQFVEEQLEDGSPLKEVQGRALNEIVRLDGTVGDALRDARRGQLGTRVIDLAEPIGAAIHAASPVFTELGVAPPEPPAALQSIQVRGASGALEQLFLNLFLNAAQALEGGGTVQVRAETEGPSVFVSITDSGPGIPPDVLERIYQPFFSTRDDGTGLGLPIALRIAKAHGGDVTVSSTSGAGTTVRVKLPVAS